MDIVINFFRWLIWMIVHLTLKITDYLYQIIASFFGLQLSNFGWIWSIYWVMVAGIGVFITGRLVMMLVRSIYDADEAQRLPGIDLMTRLMMIGLIITLVPIVMPMASNAVAEASKTILKEEILPSDIIIDSSLAKINGNLSESNSMKVEDGKHAVDIIGIDHINDKVGGKYVYFENTENLILAGVLSAGLIYCFVMVAIQIIQRLMGLLMKITLAPYAISGLVDPKDNSTSLWFRLCLADFMTAYFQMILIWIAMLVATRLPENFGGVAKGLAFIGAIFSVLIAPSGIAQLLGNDVGAQSGMMMMQHAQTMAGMTRFVGGVLGSGMYMGASFLGGAAGTTAALGIYSTGRMMGARSLNPANLPGGGLDGGGGDFDGMGGFDSPAFNEPPTEKQLHAAKKLGISGAEQMSKGELSIALENSGMNQSFWHGYSGNATSPIESYQSQASELSSGADELVGKVGRDGIVHYSDGRVNENYTRGTQSVMGAMAGAFGARLYQNAGRRLFANQNQRRAWKKRPMGTKIASTFSDYKGAYKNMKSAREGEEN